LRAARRARLVGEAKRPDRPLRETAAPARLGGRAGPVRRRRARTGGDRRGHRRLRRRATASGRDGASRRVRESAGRGTTLVSESLMPEVTYLEALRQGLWEEMERDDRVCIQGEDVGLYGGYVRGGPFHSQNPEAAFFHTPGLKIVYPATARDAKGLNKASIRDDDPVLYLEHKWLYRRIKEQLPEGEEIVTPIGEARLAREGKDLSIVTYGATVWKSLEAADRLEKEDGVAAEVLDLRTLLPMDDAAIMRTVKKTNKVLLVHEDTRTGGVAGEIAARINEQAFEWLDAPIRRVTAHDVPLPYAPTLEDFVLPQTEDIVKAARWLAAY